MLQARRRGWIFAMIAVLAAVLIGSGCANRKRSVYLNTDANFDAVQKVAVLPFDNFTNDPHAPEKLEQILLIELLSARVFELSDTGNVRVALVEAKIEQVGSMTPEQIRQVGEKLGAQALLFGTVREMSIDRSGGVPAPSISLQFKMVDALTGETIWSSVVSRHGAGTAARLFGVGGASTNEALRDLIHEALETLIR